MAWINCDLDQRWPCCNAAARVPLRGDVRYGYEPGSNTVARVPLRGDVMGMSQAVMLLLVPRFAEMLDMGMSQAEMLIASPGVPS